jgi:predicted MFS family arabinose efflux permease
MRTTLPALLALAFGTFVVGTCELVIAGILPLIAADFDESIATVGWLVSGYAIAFAVITPLVATRSGTVSRRVALVGCLLVFIVANLLAAVSPSFGVLLVGRLLSAAAAGVFEVVATATAAALVPPQRRGQAVALVVSGFSLALIVGVPLGTLLGATLGWRVPFVAIALGAALVMPGLLFGLPVLMPPAKSVSASDDWRAPLRQPAVRGALLVTGVVFTGLYTVSTYIAPFVEQVTRLNDDNVAVLLLVIGVASIAGNLLCAAAADRFGLNALLLVVCGALSASLAAVSALGASPFGVYLAVAMWGLTVGAFVPTQQTRLIGLVRGAADLALALNLSALNVGIALGAAIGGVAIDHGGLSLLGYIGAAIVSAALLLVRSSAASTAVTGAAYAASAVPVQDSGASSSPAA